MKKRVIRFVAIIMSLCLLLTGCSGKATPGRGLATAYADQELGFQLELPQEGDQVVVMHTSMGDIYIRLFPDGAPKAVENFVTHAQEGYYDGLTFHRVIEDFMIQGGDPLGTGSGGESIWGEAFADEFDAKLLNLRGAIAYANSGVDTNGSQFFINQAKAEDFVDTFSYSAYQTAYDRYKELYGTTFTDSYPTVDDLISQNLTVTNLEPKWVTDEMLELYQKFGGNLYLDANVLSEGGYTVFAQVYAGMDVVDAIAAVSTDSNNKPTTDVTILSMEVTTYGSASAPVVSESDVLAEANG